MRFRFLRPLTLALALSCASAAYAQEQDAPEGGRGMFAGMQRASGVVTAVSADKLTLKGEDGSLVQVVTTPNTRFMRNGATFKLAELKPGDGVMSMGNLDAPNKTLHAAMVISVDAEQVKKMSAARDQFMANLGKTVIAGRVTSIDLDDAKLTLERPDHVSQTISFDESTSAVPRPGTWARVKLSAWALGEPTPECAPTSQTQTARPTLAKALPSRTSKWVTTLMVPGP